MSNEPTRPTIFLELTQAEATAIERGIVFGIPSRESPERALIDSVKAKIQEAQTDEDIRSALMEDAIVNNDYDPEADEWEVPNEQEPKPGRLVCWECGEPGVPRGPLPKRCVYCDAVYDGADPTFREGWTEGTP